MIGLAVALLSGAALAVVVVFEVGRRMYRIDRFNRAAQDIARGYVSDDVLWARAQVGWDDTCDGPHEWAWTDDGELACQRCPLIMSTDDPGARKYDSKGNRL